MTHIINIAGTSGSGKSTVVRRLIEVARYGETLYRSDKEMGRIVYLGERSVFIAGRYDQYDTAGCDVIKDVRFWYDTVYEKSEQYNVVFEGLFVMNHQRGIDLMSQIRPRRSCTMHIINLTTSWEDCQASINERRARRGKGEFRGDLDNVKGHIIRANNFASKLRQRGAIVYNLERETAVNKLVEIAGCP